MTAAQTKPSKPSKTSKTSKTSKPSKPSATSRTKVAPKPGGSSGSKQGSPSGAKQGSPSGSKQGSPSGSKQGSPSGAKQASPKPESTKPDATDILAAEFIAGAGPGSELPPPTGAEVAFAGRSNVGKSSLINNLLQRKSLVRTSSTPGSTRQVNLFEARARDGAVFHMIDLPGYGFAKRSRAELASWAELIERYLKTRVTLAAAVVIVDVRRGIEPDDRELIEFIETSNEAARRPVEVLIVATKLDKIGRSARRAAVEAIAKSAGRRVIGFSAETGEGRRELWSAIRRATLGDAPP